LRLAAPSFCLFFVVVISYYELFFYIQGYTWQNQGQIITRAEPKPKIPEKTSGAGDGTVIWHEIDQRWIMYYHMGGHINMAMSEDPYGAPGTWFKHYNGTFSQPGLRGLETPIEGLISVRGSNPSIHFNTYLRLWIIVYHGWNPHCIYMSSSVDAYVWSTPQQVLCSPKEEGGRTWYPNIIGESDVLAGETARLYYAHFHGDGPREFVGQGISFTRTDDASMNRTQIQIRQQKRMQRRKRNRFIRRMRRNGNL
jgi:hypothetical protein